MLKCQVIFQKANLDLKKYKDRDMNIGLTKNDGSFYFIYISHWFCSSNPNQNDWNTSITPNFLADSFDFDLLKFHCITLAVLFRVGYSFSWGGGY